MLSLLIFYPKNIIPQWRTNNNFVKAIWSFLCFPLTPFSYFRKAFTARFLKYFPKNAWHTVVWGRICRLTGFFKFSRKKTASRKSTCGNCPARIRRQGLNAAPCSFVWQAGTPVPAFRCRNGQKLYRSNKVFPRKKPDNHFRVRRSFRRLQTANGKTHPSAKFPTKYFDLLCWRNQFARIFSLYTRWISFPEIYRLLRRRPDPRTTSPRSSWWYLRTRTE